MARVPPWFAFANAIAWVGIALVGRLQWYWALAGWFLVLLLWGAIAGRMASGSEGVIRGELPHELIEPMERTHQFIVTSWLTNFDEAGMQLAKVVRDSKTQKRTKYCVFEGENLLVFGKQPPKGVPYIQVDRDKVTLFDYRHMGYGVEDDIWD